MLWWLIWIGAAQAETWYEDADGDAFGNPDVALEADTQPSGFVDNPDDCDDAQPAINPDADEVCDAIDNNCNFRIDENAGCPCRTRFFDGTGHVYMLCGEDPDPRLTWEAARDFCLNYNYSLVTISSDAENTWLGDEYNENWWMGLNDRNDEGQFRWSDGSDRIYQNWRDGEPNDSGNEDCAHHYRDAGDWNDIQCDTVREFICESGTPQLQFADKDGDGFGSAASGEVYSSDPIPEHLLVEGDCDDSDPAINPDETEVWYDGVDQDCDDNDDDQDGDGYDAEAVGGTDCDDVDPDVRPDAADPTKNCSKEVWQEESWLGGGTSCHTGQVAMSWAPVPVYLIALASCIRRRRSRSLL